MKTVKSWAANYRQACRGYNQTWVVKQNKTLMDKDGMLNEDKRKLMNMLP